MYTSKLGFKVWKINIRAQKIDNFIVKIFKIFLASFQVKNKLKKVLFF